MTQSWNSQIYPMMISPFIPYSVEHNMDVWDWLSYLADDVAFHPDADPDWQMDCQDVHDVLAMLDVTGNLDAPLL